MAMTPEAKSKLSKTIRGAQRKLVTPENGGLRARLLTELDEATEREYRLSVGSTSANLNAARTARRKRLDDWLDEQVRTQTGKMKRSREDFRRDAVKQAAYTLLNRLVILRIMEATGLRSPLVVTGGWNSRGYKDFREIAPALVRNDESEGYSFLLKLIFEDLAVDLPGLYGPAGVADLVPVPSATIRAVVEAFDDPELESCWTDDMTLGWVYQYWNDPERESLDDKLNDGGKLEPHEIASKTQMFTERYMVDWLLQNSLGPMWLAMCRKHGWTPEVEADGTLQRLEQRRVAWRARREAGEISLTDLMPLETESEQRWAYYVPQPIPDDAVEHAPETVRDLKILDPAVGSGHFLVVAFDLLVALYKEEARHRGEADAERWSDAAIVERILEHNLHGIDLDPRAVQIAAASLWLKAQQACPPAEIKQLNLVASNLGISRLPDNDPTLVELRRVIEEETGIPGRLTMQIVEALKGADHLGSLLKIDDAIAVAIDDLEASPRFSAGVTQILMFPDGTQEQRSGPINRSATQMGILSALENFLSRHTSAQELGLRLAGQQLAAGVRFLRMVREEAYDLVVANPPYQGTSKMADASYVAKHYKLAKADLFAAFLLRGLQLVRPHCVSAMLTMRNWMFIKQYADLRRYLLQTYDLRALGDFAVGAFDEVPNDLLSVVVSAFRRQTPNETKSVAQQPTPPSDTSYDRQRTRRKRAATLCHVGRHTFDPVALKVVPEWPLVYWWSYDFLDAYAEAELLGTRTPAAKGLCTGNEERFTRLQWEVGGTSAWVSRDATPRARDFIDIRWVPYVKGGKGRKWQQELTHFVRWHNKGLEIGVFDIVSAGVRLQNTNLYFCRGVAFTKIGSTFEARRHRYLSIFSDAGPSVFPEDIDGALVMMNSSRCVEVLHSLNPTVNFQVGDVNRVPVLNITCSSDIASELESTFTLHESHRETSVEFLHPGPSPWRHAQEWAQLAVDRAEGSPLPEYVEQFEPEPPTDHLSFALGVAFGRFGANGEGTLDPSQDDLAHALPAGILFLDGSLGEDDRRDSLGHTAARIIHENWSEYGPAIDNQRSLRDWLREKFFADVHKGMYENRPIHWPLSSKKKTFVAWMTIHRWNDQTLRVLLADHLEPALKRLDGEIADLTQARAGSDTKQVRSAEQRYDDVKAWRDELAEFIENVRQCAERGPAAADAKRPEREADARYDPDLDDGVMINSAALWPLLEPQWKDPQKWWKELVAATGKKDYDWSHLAMRYWPTRVDKKCQADPSLGVAHGCFWKYHPAKAWAWELRLQDEIGPDFRIEEAPYRGEGGDAEHRTAYLKAHPTEALGAVEKEALRRRRKKGCAQNELTLREAGLWSSVPEECWQLEMKLIEKQKADFRLLAPDEPSARSAYEKKHASKIKARKALLNELKPAKLFSDAVEDDEDETSEVGEEVA